MVISLRRLSESLFRLLDCLTEVHLCGQFSSLTDHPSNFCWNRGMVFFEGAPGAEFGEPIGSTILAYFLGAKDSQPGKPQEGY